MTKRLSKDTNTRKPPAKGGALPKASGDPARVAAVTAIRARLDTMLERLGASPRVKLKRRKNPYAPLGEEEIAAWEKRNRVRLPEDYRIFLQLVGGVAVEWRFKETDAHDDEVGGALVLGGLPTLHSLAKDRSFPEYRGLFHFWEVTPEMGYCLRLDAAGSESLVWEDGNDSAVTDRPESFLALLAAWVEWWGISPARFSTELPVADGLRDLEALYEAAVLAPSLDPTEAGALVEALRRAEDSTERGEILDALAALGPAAASDPGIAATVGEVLRLAQEDDENEELSYQQVYRALAALGYHTIALEVARRCVALCGDLDDERAEASLVVIARHGSSAEAASALARLIERVSAGDYPRYDGQGALVLSTVELLVEYADGRAALAALSTEELPHQKLYLDDTLQRLNRLFAGAGIASPFVAARQGSAAELADFARTYAPELDIGWRPVQSPERERLDAWFDEVIRGIEAGRPVEALPVTWAGPEFRVRASVPTKIPRFRAPERIEILECDDAASIEGLRAFTGVRELKLAFREEGKHSIEPIAALLSLEVLDIYCDSGRWRDVDFSFLGALSRLRRVTVKDEAQLATTSAERLGQALARLPALESLNFDLGEAGNLALLRGLAGGPLTRLRELRMGMAEGDPVALLLEGAFAGLHILRLDAFPRKMRQRLRGSFYVAAD